MTADVILLQMKYALIISMFSKNAGIDEEKALELLNTYMLMRKGISNFYCMSNAYLAEKILLE